MVLPLEILIGRAEFLFLFISSKFQQVSCENPPCYGAQLDWLMSELLGGRPAEKSLNLTITTST